MKQRLKLFTDIGVVIYAGFVSVRELAEEVLFSILVSYLGRKTFEYCGCLIILISQTIRLTAKNSRQPVSQL